MPDQVFLNRQDYNRAQADLFEQTARRRLADHWEESVRLRLPDLIGETQRKLQDVLSPPQGNANAISRPDAYRVTPQPATFPSAATPPVGQEPAPVASLQAPVPQRGVTGGTGTLAGPPDVEGYIRQTFAARGHDPDVAARVYASEGKQGYVGDSQSSFGPFQLHYGGVASGGNAVAGLGDEFTRETGLDARDPSTWKAQIDWVADKVGQTGWTPWHGAAATGIGTRQGIGTGQTAVAMPSGTQQARAPGGGVSQFELGLSAEDAAAACGPAAAIAFANQFGRNPTADEAMQLAKRYGWTRAQGMAGIESEQKLLSEGLGVPTRLERKVSWSNVAADAANGNPVVVSTAGHYFVVGQDPDTGRSQDDQGRLYVGKSGTDLRGGSAWMSPAEMQQRMGAVQGALFADNPSSPIDSIAKAAGDFFSGLGSAVRPPASAPGGGFDPSHMGAGGPPSEQPFDPGAAGRLLGDVGGFLSGETARRARAQPWSPAFQAEAGQVAANPPTMRADPLSVAFGSSLGEPTGGQALTEERERFIAERNPLRDVPVLGGATTLAAQMAADPTNLLLAGPGATRAAGRAASALPRRLPGEAEAGFAAGLPRRPDLPAAGFEQVARMPGTRELAPIREQSEQTGTDLLAAMAQELRARGKDTTAIEQAIVDMDTVAAARRAWAPGARAPAEAATGGRMPATVWVGAAQRDLDITPPGRAWLQRESATQPMLPGIEPAGGGSLADKAVTVRYAGLLANWYTQIGNILGNTGQAFVQPVRLAASGHPREAGAFIRGMGESVGTANRNAANVVATGADTVSKAQYARTGAFGTGPLGKVMDASAHFMAGADEWFQSVAKGGFVRAEAARQARGNAQRYEQLWQHPTQATLEAADQFARRATYTEDPGRLIAWLSERQGLSDAQRVGVTLLVPFLRTTTNILRRGVSFSAKPVTGTVGAVGKLIQGDVRGATFDVADALLSSVVLAGFASKAANGELSGEGPTDPGERRLLVSQGWQPHSMRVGDRWYDYSFAGPLAIPASLVANWHEGMREGKAHAPTDEEANRLINRLSKSVLRQTFLSNIGDLFDDRGGGAVGVLQNLIAQTVAPSVVRDVAQAIDPYERKPEQGLVGGTLGKIGERIPGVSRLVPAEQDVLGRPLASRRGGIPQPIRNSAVHTDPIIEAFRQADLNISQPRDTITLGQGARSLQVRVQPEEQRRWNAYRGEMLQRIGGGFLDSPEFSKAPLVVRQRVLRRLLDASSHYATAQLARELPDLHARLGEAINEKIVAGGYPASTPAAPASSGPTALEAGLAQPRRQIPSAPVGLASPPMPAMLSPYAT